MELSIIQELDWQLHPVTPNCFLHQFFCLFPKDMDDQAAKKINDVSQLVVEMLTCRERSFRGLLPSELAVCAMLTAMECVGYVEDLCVRQRQVIWSEFGHVVSSRAAVQQDRKLSGNLRISLCRGMQGSMFTRLQNILGEVSSHPQKEPHRASSLFHGQSTTAQSGYYRDRR